MSEDESKGENEPRRPPPRRARPVPKTKTPAKTLSNGTPDKLVEMEREWDAKLAARARPADEPSNRHPLAYNFPLAYVRRPDGDIVQLQSDPNNRMLYEDLGFVYLSPRETREWLDVVQPRVVQEQREKSAIITALRRFESRTTGFTLEYDALDSTELFSEMSLERLREVHAEIQEEVGKPIRIPRPRAEPKAEKAAQDADAAVEGNHLQQRLQAGRLKEIQPNQPFGFV
jgi:hypothetical protein